MTREQIHSWETTTPERGPMNKNDLIDSVIEEHDVTRTFARDLVDSVFGSIADAARKGEEVSIFGFGKFRVTERGSRKGRNPKTGDAVSIPAKRVAYFKPGKELKELINRDDEQQ